MSNTYTYNIYKSDGTLLTTISDGTINTTSTSLGLPGRLYSGYGQVFDTNYVHLMENFAAQTAPNNAIRGQLWYNITSNVLSIATIDAPASNQWISVATFDSAGNLIVPSSGPAPNNVTLTGNIYINNAFLTGNANVVSVNASNGIFTSNTAGNVKLFYDSSNNAVGEFQGNIANYIQVLLWNSNISPNASSDFAIYDTTGPTNSSNNFIDIGILSNTWSNSSWTINGPSDAYIYAGNTNLAVGTAGQSNIQFFTGGTLASNEKMRIATNGNVGIGQTNPAYTLDVTGNIRATSSIVAASITGNHYGNGSGLTNILSSAISGTVANANYSVYAAQSTNVTVTDDSTNPIQYYPVFVTGAGTSVSLGLDTALTYVASSNTMTVGNLVVTGTITGGTTTSGTAATVTSNAQPNITSVGTLTGLTVNGTLSAININGVTNLTAANITGTLTTGPQPNITTVGTLALLNVTGNISGANLTGNLFGNGSGISNITGPNVIGTVANANYAVYAQQLVGGAGASTAVTVTANSQPNITTATNLTSIGTLGTLNVTGNVTSVSGVFNGNGAGLTNILSTNIVGAVANAQFANNAAIASSANTATFATQAGSLAAGASATTAQTVTSNSQPNITTATNLTTVGTLGTLTVTGNITSGGTFKGNGSGLTNIANTSIVGAVASAYVASVANSVAGANVTGTVATATTATTAGTVTTNAQPNITSVGLLNGLVSSNTVDVTTPNSGTTGGIRIRANSLSGNAYLQITDSTGVNQWGYWQSNSIANSNISWSGNLTTAGIFYGNGAGLANINGSNVSQVPSAVNATYASSAGTVNSITSAQISSALGYTPYSSANPSNYVQLSQFTQNFNQGGTSGLSYGGTKFGWTKLPNGLIIQWGNDETYHPGEGGVTVTFPVSFPTMVLTVMAVDKGQGYGDAGDDMWVQVPYIYNSGCTVFYQSPSSGNNGYGYRWVAFGY